MSIQPEIKEPTNAENADDERADRPHRSDSPTSTTEVAKETERPERSATSDDAAITLFPEKEANDFHTRWTDIQTGFVDEPRRSVEQADALVAEVINAWQTALPKNGPSWKDNGVAATMSRPKIYE